MTIQVATIFALFVLAMGALGVGVGLSRSRAKAVRALADATVALQQEKNRADAANRKLSEVTAWGKQQERKAQVRHEGLLRALRQLVGVDLPAALRGEVAVAGSSAVADEEVAAVVGHALELAAAAGKESADLETVRLAVVALARRIQAAAHRSQQYAVGMGQENPGNPAVTEACMRLDHLAAQQARQAASLAVLCGEVPGQQWTTPLPLVDVARAGSGRIEPYSRVDVVGDQTVAVVAEAVEGLIHMVAELLANAAQSSPPSSRVMVQVTTVQQGAVIQIDDCGPGVTEHQLAEMSTVVSGDVPRGVADLGEVPQMGLAVVGEYVRRLGLHADLQMSVYGGLRAVVRVPERLVTELPLNTSAGTATNGRGLETRTENKEPGDLDGRGRHAASGELPTRRSRRDEALQPERTALPQAATASDETPGAAGKWMDRYFAAGEPAADSSDTHGPKEH